jgi:hypothetical protein
MKRHIVTLIIIILLAIAANTRLEQNQYATFLAWDWGGVDLLPKSALFICPGWYDDHYLGHFTPNPIAPLFPDLIADC